MQKKRKKFLLRVIAFHYIQVNHFLNLYIFAQVVHKLDKIGNSLDSRDFLNVF